MSTAPNPKPTPLCPCWSTGHYIWSKDCPTHPVQHPHRYSLDDLQRMVDEAKAAQAPSPVAELLDRADDLYAEPRLDHLITHPVDPNKPRAIGGGIIRVPTAAVGLLCSAHKMALMQATRRWDCADGVLWVNDTPEIRRVLGMEQAR